MNYSLGGIRQLIINDGIDNIPYIDTNPDSAVAAAIGELVTLKYDIDPTANKRQFVEKAIGTIEDALNNGQTKIARDVLSILPAKLGESINNAFRAFHTDIIPVADELFEDIKKDFTRRLINDRAYDESVDDHEPTEDDFRFIKWGDLNNAATQEEVILKACEAAGYSQPMLSRSYVDNILGKLTVKDIKAVNIEKDIVRELREAFVKKYGDQVSEELFDRFVGIVTDQRKSRTFLAKVLSMTKYDPKSYADNLLFLTALLESADTFVFNLTKVAADILDQDTLNTISANLKILEQVMFGIKYWCLLQRNEHLANTLLLSKDIILYNNYKKFVKDGGNIALIYQYTMIVGDSKIPLYGIATSTINDKNVTEIYTKNANRLKERARILKIKHLADAFKLRMNAYGRELLDSMADEDDHEKHELIERLEALTMSKLTFLNGDLSKVLDAITEIIVGVLYNDRLEMTLFKYIRTGLAERITEGDEALEVNAIEYEICAGLVSEYLIRKLKK